MHTLAEPSVLNNYTCERLCTQKHLFYLGSHYRRKVNSLLSLYIGKHAYVYIIPKASYSLRALFATCNSHNHLIHCQFYPISQRNWGWEDPRLLLALSNPGHGSTIPFDGQANAPGSCVPEDQLIDDSVDYLNLEISTLFLKWAFSLVTSTFPREKLYWSYFCNHLSECLFKTRKAKWPG